VEGAADIWTWTAIRADTKLVPSWLVGSRDAAAANMFMQDLAGRMANRIQLASDGQRLYLEAVEGAFGAEIDFGMLIKTMARLVTMPHDTAHLNVLEHRPALSQGLLPLHIYRPVTSNDKTSACGWACAGSPA
jgi:hypothetical protein